MGCIVYSSAISDFRKHILIDPLIDQLFNNANEFVLDQTGKVDEGLRMGHLLSSITVRMLDRATSEDCFVAGRWPTEKVKEMFDKAQWDFRYLTEHTWAYLSAKQFLTVCEKAGLSIRFFFGEEERDKY